MAGSDLITTVKLQRSESNNALQLAAHGLRTIEIHRLICGDVGRIWAPPVLAVYGKGHDRTVYLRADTGAALAAWLAERGNPAPDKPLFTSECNRTTGARLSGRGIRSIVDQALTAVDLKQHGGKRVSTHTLRHSFATLSLLAGANPRHVQAQAGWKSAEMLSVYGHVVERARNNPSELLAL